MHTSLRMYAPLQPPARAQCVCGTMRRSPCLTLAPPPRRFLLPPPPSFLLRPEDTSVAAAMTGGLSSFNSHSMGLSVSNGDSASGGHPHRAGAAHSRRHAFAASTSMLRRHGHGHGRGGTPQERPRTQQADRSLYAGHSHTPYMDDGAGGGEESLSGGQWDHDGTGGSPKRVTFGAAGSAARPSTVAGRLSHRARQQHQHRRPASSAVSGRPGHGHLGASPPRVRGGDGQRSILRSSSAADVQHRGDATNLGYGRYGGSRGTRTSGSSAGGFRRSVGGPGLGSTVNVLTVLEGDETEFDSGSVKGGGGVGAVGGGGEGARTPPTVAGNPRASTGPGGGSGGGMVSLGQVGGSPTGGRRFVESTTRRGRGSGRGSGSAVDRVRDRNGSTGSNPHSVHVRGRGRPTTAARGPPSGGGEGGGRGARKGGGGGGDSEGDDSDSYSSDFESNGEAEAEAAAEAHRGGGGKGGMDVAGVTVAGRTSNPYSSTVHPKTKQVNVPKSQLASAGGIAHWQRGDLIGSGSYGQVYSALNLVTGDTMAVKLVKLAEHAGRDKEVRVCAQAWLPC